MNTRPAIAAHGILAVLVTAVVGCAAGRPAGVAAYPSPAATLAADTRAPAVSEVPVVRGQDGGPRLPLREEDPGSNFYTRTRMPVTVAQYQPSAPPGNGGYVPGPSYPPGPSAGPLSGSPPAAAGPMFSPPPGPPGAAAPVPLLTPNGPPVLASPNPLWNGQGAPQFAPPGTEPPLQPVQPLFTDIDVYGAETQTGRFMFGAGVNSDAGVTGQITIDERNFDITRVPTSWRDFVDGTAFRGAGQGFRLEAMPGTQVQRYLASFTEPYLFSTPISFNLSAFLYDRVYTNWTEGRIGGRVALGYRLTPDLSVSTALRAEKIHMSNPYEPYGSGSVPQLDSVLGYSDLFTGRATLTHDTRDIPFSPTEGHLIELSFEQAFGDYSYPRAELDLRKYFLVRERPDGSGRHTLGYILQLGFSGTDTPLFENYFAGGYSTLRGFNFRGASPEVNGVRVGGIFKFLGSVEYTFPVTADDMLKGALWVDYGTVEQTVALYPENFRVSPGFGVRINVPALGPAPLAFDFGFPVHMAPGDETRVFNFFFGMGR
ncbi:MAG: BamA/TamA family outer membrane protein [Planctomycetota bacterium]|nr:BamA/TamA family outer membrane protein [Planctomycetota bacterium]